MGRADDDDHLVTRAVRSRFQFRGVLGTYSADHAAGTPILPVWRVEETAQLTRGQPGRFDAVMVMDYDNTAIGWPGIVQHTQRPRDYTVHSYAEGGAPLTAAAGAPDAAVPHARFQLGATYVALQEPLGVPVPAGADPALAATGQLPDQRRVSRLSKFPSGERPRVVDTVAVGNDFRSGSGGAAVPSAVVDELVFGSTTFGVAVGGGDAFEGGGLVLVQRCTDADRTLQVDPRTLRSAQGDAFTSSTVLSWLPQDAGLLRIGDEILCYDGYDADSGVLSLPAGGRGLLGTDPQSHMPGEAAWFLSTIRVSVLVGEVGPGDHALPVLDAAGFPPEGTVLVEDELIHYTRVQGGALEMPRASLVPGAMDRKGGGLFRGRYGTDAAGHAAGAVVVCFPFRYWDRWAERADAPELHYFGLSLSQPAAFWRTALWDVEAAGAAGPRLGVLLRTDPDTPWDADPDATEELELHWDGMRGGEGVPIGGQSDRCDWRAFVRYEPGSFDPQYGLAHGWKATPRLRMLAVEYMAPGMTLRRVER